MADVAGNFMRIEREDADGKSRHYIVHVHDPKFAMELAPDPDAPDQLESSVLKRVIVPNSWAGNYGQYASLMKAAQEFFRQSMQAEPAAKHETRRLKF
jgi:hypothetical protein